MELPGLEPSESTFPVLRANGKRAVPRGRPVTTTAAAFIYCFSGSCATPALAPDTAQFVQHKVADTWPCCGATNQKLQSTYSDRPDY